MLFNASLFRSLRRAESLELRPGLLQIVVNHDLVMHARRLRKRNLVLRLLQTRQNRLLAVRSAASQPLLQNLHGRRLQEEEARVQIRLLDLLDSLQRSPTSASATPLHDQSETHLHLNIQNARLPLLPHIFHCLHARPVKVAAELRVLDEAVGVDELSEILPRHKVVVPVILLAGAWVARRVRDAEAVAVGVGGEQALEEGRLAGARGAGDHDWAGVCVGRGCC